MIAFLYAGQGSQIPGMGTDFYELDTLKPYFDALGDLKTVAFQGPAEALKQTETAQPVLAAFAMAVTALLAAHGLTPDVTGGLSLGQYSALAAAGMMDHQTLIQLTKVRGAAMADAAIATPGGMMAVLGMKAEEVQSLLVPLQESGTEVWLANDNMPGQQVIAGRSAALALTKEHLQKAGARRVIPLKTSGAFHTPLMASARQPLQEALLQMPLQKMQRPVYSNVTAHTLQEADIVADLLTQLTAPVRLREMLLQMQADGVDMYIEIGPGHVLADCVRRTLGKDTRVITIETLEDVHHVLEMWGGIV